MKSYKNLSLDEQYLLDKKNQQTFYYHRDHLGSIIALSNDKKEIIEEFIYDDSYGKILKHEKLVETYNPYCYTGREFDNHELYYYRARYYDPTLQIFLSKDPIEFLSGDYNFYRYVANDPVNFTDPSGLLAFLAVPLVEAAAEALAAAAVRAIGVAVVRNAPAISRTIGLSRVLGWENVYEQTEEEKILEQTKTAAETLTQIGVNVRAEVLTEEAVEEKRCKDRTGKDTEAIMDDYYKSRGYIKVSIDKYHGIDGVYIHKITGGLVVAEAKFGKSQLSRTTDGNRQMSDNWIQGRNKIDQIPDETIRERIDKKDYKPEIFRRKHDCTAWVHDVIQPLPSEAVEFPIGRPVIF